MVNKELTEVDQEARFIARVCVRFATGLIDYLGSDDDNTLRSAIKESLLDYVRTNGIPTAYENLLLKYTREGLKEQEQNYE
jgi:hypothetical protein